MHRIAVIILSILCTWLARLGAAGLSSDAPKIDNVFFDMTFDFLASAAVTMIIVDRIVRSARNTIRSDAARASWAYFTGALIIIIIIRYLFPRLTALPTWMQDQGTILFVSNILAGALLAHASYLDETLKAR